MTLVTDSGSMFENVTYTFSHSSLDNLNFDINQTDVFVNKIGLPLVPSVVVGSLLFVVPVNLFVLFWIKNKTQTLIDQLMILDCISNIGSLTIFLTVINDSTLEQFSQQS